MSKFNQHKINPNSIQDYKHYGLKNRRDNTITPKQYIVLGFVLIALIMAYSIVGMI